VIFENPYCTLVELKRALKFPQTDTERDAELKQAIWHASRWVDEYKGRVYYYIDRSADPLIFDAQERNVYGDTIYPPEARVLRVDSLTLGDTSLVEDTDFVITFDRDRIIKLAGDWLPTRPDRVLKIYGHFGFWQSGSWPVSEAGDAANQVATWTLINVGALPIYWGLDLNAGTRRVRLWRDAAHTTLLAEGSRVGDGSVTLTERNDSEISGTVAVTYTVDDVDVANILTPTTPTITRTAVPTDLPGPINFAAIQVAAVFSGHDRKEVAGLDGLATSVLTNVIPASVYKILGPRHNYIA
jgi:hypothetical protein